MFIRYKISTKEELHRSAVPYTIPCEPDEEDIIVDEMPDEFGVCRVENGELVVDPEKKTEREWFQIREERNRRLIESDVPRKIAEDNGNVDLAIAWKFYQISLRNVPDQDDPFNIVWPVSP